MALTRTTGFGIEMEVRTLSGNKKVKDLRDHEILFDEHDQPVECRVGPQFFSQAYEVSHKAFGVALEGVHNWEYMLVSKDMKFLCTTSVGVKPYRTINKATGKNVVLWYSYCPSELVHPDGDDYRDIAARRIADHAHQLEANELDLLLQDAQPERVEAAGAPRRDNGRPRRAERSPPHVEGPRDIILHGLSEDSQGADVPDFYLTSSNISSTSSSRRGQEMDDRMDDSQPRPPPRRPFTPMELDREGSQPSSSPTSAIPLRLRVRRNYPRGSPAAGPSRLRNSAQPRTPSPLAGPSRQALIEAPPQTPSTPSLPSNSSDCRRIFGQDWVRSPPPPASPSVDRQRALVQQEVVPLGVLEYPAPLRVPEEPAGDDPLPDSSSDADDLPDTDPSASFSRGSQNPSSDDTGDVSDRPHEDIDDALRAGLAYIRRRLFNSVCSCGIFCHRSASTAVDAHADTYMRLLNSQEHFSLVDPLRVWDCDKLISPIASVHSGKHRAHAAKQLRLFVALRYHPGDALRRNIFQLPVPPYYLGAYKGDGSQGDTVITTCDQEMIHWLRHLTYLLNKYVRPDGQEPVALQKRLTNRRDEPYRINMRDGTHKTNTYMVAFRGPWNPLRDGLRQLGMLRNKCLPLGPEYTHGGKDVQCQFAAGLIDTDGSCDPDRGYVVTQASGPHDLILEDLRNCINNLSVPGVHLHCGWLAPVETEYLGQPYHISRLLISGDLHVLAEYCQLPRKKNVFMRTRQTDQFGRRGMKVKLADEVAVMRPIQVEGHTFQRHDRCVLYDTQPDWTPAEGERVLERCRAEQEAEAQRNVADPGRRRRRRRANRRQAEAPISLPDAEQADDERDDADDGGAEGALAGPDSPPAIVAQEQGAAQPEIDEQPLYDLPWHRFNPGDLDADDEGNVSGSRSQDGEDESIHDSDLDVNKVTDEDISDEDAHPWQDITPRW